MKITVERDLFAAAIGAANRVAGEGVAIPILNNLLLTPNEKSLGIVGTNLDMQVETELPAEIEGKEKHGITAIGHALAGIVDSLPKGSTITLEWSDNLRDGVVVKAGKSRYKILALSAADFPAAFAINDPVTFSVPAKSLSNALNTIKFAISKDTQRHYICGALMHLVGEKKDTRFSFCATNGADLARVLLPIPDGLSSLPPSCIVPDRAVAEIIKLCASHADDHVSVSVTPSGARFVFGAITFSTKLIDGIFPDYVKVIPVEPPHRMLADCDALSQVLDRLCEIGDGLKLRASFKAPGNAIFQLVDHDVGEGREEMEIEWRGDDLDIGLRARSILSVLENIDADQCSIEFTDSRSPLRIHAMRAGKQDQSTLFVTMPVI